MMIITDQEDYREEGSTKFDTVDGITYLCCDCCDKPIVQDSNLFYRQEDENGKSYNGRLVHYKCRAFFDATHKGRWFSKGMVAVRIIW